MWTIVSTSWCCKHPSGAVVHTIGQPKVLSKLNESDSSCGLSITNYLLHAGQTTHQDPFTKKSCLQLRSAFRWDKQHNETVKRPKKSAQFPTLRMHNLERTLFEFRPTWRAQTWSWLLGPEMATRNNWAIDLLSWLKYTPKSVHAGLKSNYYQAKAERQKMNSQLQYKPFN